MLFAEDLLLCLSLCKEKRGIVGRCCVKNEPQMRFKPV